MMKDIDFLPLEYRQQHAKRAVQVWRIMVVALFLAMLGAASLLQYYRLCRLHGQITEFAVEQDAAKAQNEQLQRIQARCKEATTDAELFTYLRHPWPRSQLLSSLLAPLPDSATLQQLEIKTDASRGAVRARRPSNVETNVDEALAKSMSPAERDLAALRQQWDRAVVTAILSGATTDADALHRYLGVLARSSLFLKVELDSLDMATPGEGVPEGLMAFRAVVTIRPGYGQPDGPVGAAHVAQHAATTHRKTTGASTAPRQGDKLP